MQGLRQRQQSNGSIVRWRDESEAFHAVPARARGPGAE
jgi:hypothetical protein